MTESSQHPEPNDVRDIAERLRAGGPQPTALDMDRIKRIAMQRASRVEGGVMNLRTRVTTALLALVLVVSGGGAVLAAAGGSSSHGSSSNSQYCPHDGKPKHGHGKGHDKGGNDCGEDNGGGHGNGDGDGNGDGHGNGGDNGKGHGH